MCGYGCGRLWVCVCVGGVCVCVCVRARVCKNVCMFMHSEDVMHCKSLS